MKRQLSYKNEKAQTIILLLKFKNMIIYLKESFFFPPDLL